MPANEANSYSRSVKYKSEIEIETFFDQNLLFTSHRMDSSGSGSESDKASESLLGSSPGTSSQAYASDGEVSDK